MNASNSSLGAQQNRQLQDRILTNSFWTLCFVGLLNINGLTLMVFQASRIMSVVFLGLGLLILIRSAHWRKSMGASGAAFFVFMFSYLFISSIVRIDVSLLIGQLGSCLIVLVCGVATRQIVLVRGLHYFMKWVLVLTVLGALTIYLSPFLESMYAKTPKIYKIYRKGRWLGFFQNPNWAGMACVCVLCPCLAGWKLRQRDFPIKKYIPFALAACGLAVLLTFSRSAIFLYGFVLVAFTAIKFRFDARMVLALIGASAGLVVFVWFFTSGYRQFEWSAGQLRRIQSIGKILEGESESSDTGGRMDGISGGLAYWSLSPWSGHGLGSLHRMPDKYFRGFGCHNTHVMILGESGVFGAISYIFFLFVFFKAILKARQGSIKVFCIVYLVLFLSNGMVSHDIIQDRNLNILMGVCFGLLSVDR